MDIKVESAFLVEPMKKRLVVRTMALTSFKRNPGNRTENINSVMNPKPLQKALVPVAVPGSSVLS